MALGASIACGLAAGAPIATALAETPACTAATAGQLSIQANVQCECRFFRASPAAGTPAGHRWDCGILRARTNQDVPATANPYPYPLPDALALGRGFVIDPSRTPAVPLDPP